MKRSGEWGYVCEGEKKKMKKERKEEIVQLKNNNQRDGKIK